MPTPRMKKGKILDVTQNPQWIQANEQRLRAEENKERYELLLDLKNALECGLAEQAEIDRASKLLTKDPQYFVSHIEQIVESRPDIQKRVAEKLGRQWVNETPAETTYALTMFDECGGTVQALAITRVEFIALKKHLAQLRGYSTEGQTDAA